MYGVDRAAAITGDAFGKLSSREQKKILWISSTGNVSIIDRRRTGFGESAEVEHVSCASCS